MAMHFLESLEFWIFVWFRSCMETKASVMFARCPTFFRRKRLGTWCMAMSRQWTAWYSMQVVWYIVANTSAPGWVGDMCTCVRVCVCMHDMAWPTFMSWPCMTICTHEHAYPILMICGQKPDLGSVTIHACTFLACMTTHGLTMHDCPLTTLFHTSSLIALRTTFMHRVEMHACCHGMKFCMHIVIWVVGMLVPVAHGCGDMCRKNQCWSCTEWQKSLLTNANGWYVGWCWVSIFFIILQVRKYLIVGTVAWKSFYVICLLHGRRWICSDRSHSSP